MCNSWMVDRRRPQLLDSAITSTHNAHKTQLNLRCPDFPKALEWVNAPPLSLSKELRGKLVLLDFWTYCCINCMHVLPNLAKLEKKYQDQPFVVVGVHSAKCVPGG